MATVKQIRTLLEDSQTLIAEQLICGISFESKTEYLERRDLARKAEKSSTS
ncbi:MAG: hypothetical protein V1808_00245 [Candidatus Daviesbacteria bacterium]